MLMRDDLHIAGRLTLRKTTLDGHLVEEVSARNHITTAGRDLVARLFNKENAGTSISRVSKIHVGRSGVDFVATQTGLLDKVGETPITNIESLLTTVSGLQRVQLRLTGELGENDCNDALCEAGLFTDDGVMYNRVTFGTITKTNQFKLTLIWEILF